MPVEAPIVPSTPFAAPPERATGRRFRRIGPSPRRAKAARNPLKRLFWAALIGLISMVAAKSPGQSPESILGAMLIVVSAMLPSYLWVSGKAHGLPLFPACALSSTWTYALPLVSEHPIIVLFPGWNQLIAALSVTGFLLIGTLCWYLAARRKPRPPVTCLMMDEKLSQPLLLTALAVCIVYSVAAAAGWLRLSTGADSVARAIVTAVEAMSCFVLGYELGSGRMSPGSKVTFFASVGALLLSIMPGLLLIVAMCLMAVMLMGYVVASNRLPWLVCVVGLAAFGFLHLGKAPMREKYWHEEEDPTVSPLQYPGFMLEWAQSSMQALRHGNADDDASESLLERASLMHWLLYFEAVTPTGVPFLNGETYAVIPQLLVPRLFNPDKPRSHEATYILAVHYGIQTREDTQNTTIAFGLVSEAFANFGFLGIGALAVALGSFYGLVAHWASRMPLLSLRGLFAVLIASYSFQAEFISTYYAAALFQSTIVMLVLSAVLMRTRPVSRAQIRLSY